MSRISEKSSGRAVWGLIIGGAALAVTVYMFGLARFVDVSPAALRQGLVMSRSELAFMLFPFLSLAYFRLYAARTVWSRRLTALAAVVFAGGGAAVSLWLMARNGEAELDFFLHSLVCLMLLPAFLPFIFDSLRRSWPKGGRPPAEAMALIPFAAMAVAVMSYVSMTGTRQLIGPALTAPYVLLALDLLRRGLAGLFASKKAVSPPPVRRTVILDGAVFVPEFETPAAFRRPGRFEVDSPSCPEYAFDPQMASGCGFPGETVLRS